MNESQFDLSEKTAIKRQKRSAPANYVEKYIIPKYKPISILDYGCGYGKDVEFYTSVFSHSIVYIDGWDPHPNFGWHCITRKYDLIVCAYVFNVNSNLDSIIENIKKNLADNGVIFFASRSYASIEQAAKKGKWAVVNRTLKSGYKINIGYCSSIRKKTFQRGIAMKDYENLAKTHGMVILPIKHCKISGAVCALMKIKK